MSRVLLIARREFVTHLRRRGYLFTTFGMPLVIGGIIVVLMVSTVRRETATGDLGAVGYVDQAGVLAPGMARPPEFQPYENMAAAQAALDAGEIGGYFVVPADYLATGRVDAYAYGDIPGGIEEQMRDFLLANLLAGRPVAQVRRLREPMNWTLKSLDGTRTVTEETAPAFFSLPFVFALVFMMGIFTTSQYLMQGVVEEKENRLIEILVTAVRPTRLLWGKVAGMGVLALFQFAVWMAIGLLILFLGRGRWSALTTIQVPMDYLMLAVLYFIPGYLLYAGLMAGIGAVVTAQQEGQQIAALIGMLAVSPLIASAAFITQPDGVLATTLSLVPFSASVGMVMRLAFTQVPAWQIGLSLALLVASAVGAIWLAAQVFRVGLLMVGQGLRWGTLIRAWRAGGVG